MKYYRLTRLLIERIAYAFILASTPGIAFAGSSSSTGCSGSSSINTSFASITTTLEGLANLFTNTWLRALLL
ncbi:MAG: hypothetical protein ACYDG3_09785, partial [Bacillati bacterium]